MNATHPRLRVKVAEHEAGDPAATAWRIRHANETIQAVTLAYFGPGGGADPAQADDGTFEVHAVSRDTLPTLRQILTEHEGLTIVAEDEAPGDGIVVNREMGL